MLAKNSNRLQPFSSKRPTKGKRRKPKVEAKSSKDLTKENKKACQKLRI